MALIILQQWDSMSFGTKLIRNQAIWLVEIRNHVSYNLFIVVEWLIMTQWETETFTHFLVYFFCSLYFLFLDPHVATQGIAFNCI